jgi:hypothetical protein
VSIGVLLVDYGFKRDTIQARIFLMAFLANLIEGRVKLV